MKKKFELANLSKNLLYCVCFSICALNLTACDDDDENGTQGNGPAPIGIPSSVVDGVRATSMSGVDVTYNEDGTIKEAEVDGNTLVFNYASSRAIKVDPIRSLISITSSERRVVSATNADLRKMVSERTFREDLFYRINLITVKLPSLRERREDIPLLARHFADRQAEVNGLPRTDFSADALNFLSRLPYPGNIRELKNLVERTILVSGKPVLDATDFDAQYLRHDEPAKAAEGTSFAGMTLDEIERQTILQALEQHKGNLSQVAVSLGISRAALYRRLEKYNIQVPCA